MFFKQMIDNKPVGFLITQENLEHVLVDLDFSLNPPPGVFELRGFAVVVPTEKPNITPYQRVYEIDCTLNEDGTWRQQWQVENMSDEEAQSVYDTQLEKVTEYRDRLVGIYNMQLADAGDPAEIEKVTGYLNATLAVDLSDPFNVVWPTITD